MARSSSTMPAVLTVAGSDSGGGAGIQADLKTFAALDVFGVCAITCVTAQNPDAVSGIAEIPTVMVIRQIRAACEGFPVAAAKTGMLYSIPLILAVANELALRAIPRLVVDPVMVSSSGAPLLRPDAVRTLSDRLFHRATVITPNRDEAAVLCGRPVTTQEEQAAAARELSVRFGVAVVVKGGHLPGRTVVDVLYAAGKTHRFAQPRLNVPETHGTGCVFSAALAAGLARGAPLPAAVKAAQLFTRAALKRAVPVGHHCPLQPG